MKKILSLALALVFMFALAIPAFAADPATLNSASSSKDVTATYNVGEGYTVTIPSGITFSAEKTANETVTVSNVYINANKKVVVTLKAAGEDTAFELKYDNDALTYTVKTNLGNGDATTAIAATGGTVVEVNAGTVTGATAALAFQITEDAIYQGEYTDTLTFSVTVAAQQQ